MSERENRRPDPAAPFYKPPQTDSHQPLDIIREAENRRLWIYHPQSENWYSPAEFMEKYGSMLNCPELFQGITVCRPEEGLQTLRRLLKDASDELNHLTDRVINYYRTRTAQGTSVN